MEFYNTLKTQFELLPRVAIVYGKGYVEDGFGITDNGIGFEWLWFGVFFKIGKSKE